MREIKFRAWWQPTRLDYHKGVLINPPKMLQVGDGSGTKTRLDCCAYANQGQNVVLMQYTGRKDNTKWEQLTVTEQEEWLRNGKTREEWNGKEIYERDIVTRRNRADLPCLVYFDDRDFAYRLAVRGDKQYDKTYPLMFSGHIIGNIYETPELLGTR